MERFLDLFFAPVHVPVAALLRFVFRLMGQSRTTLAMLQYWCAAKSVLYGLMAVLVGYAVATPEPSAMSVLPTETIQAVLALATYVLAALAWAHYRSTQHLSRLRKSA